ncbi:MAG: NAD(+) diphosphatase [Propylenella sp.]
MSSFFDNRIFREASHENGFSGNLIERWSEARGDFNLDEALGARNAVLYIFTEDRALLRLNGERLNPRFGRNEARALGLDAESVILLGVAPNGPRLAGLVSENAERPDDIKAIDLRSLAMQEALDPADLAGLAQARSYLHWHAANRFCGRCGEPLAVQGGGVSRSCAKCETQIFPRVDPVVIMLAIDGERCLLGRQARFAPGMYSALAGFLEPGETIEEAVRREVKEEAGITIGRVAYHSSQAWPFPHSLMIGCHAEALSTNIERDAEELEDCCWFERKEVRLMLAGAHPDGLKAPFRMAIAHHLIRAFAA